MKAQRVAKQLGVPLSLVINNYLRDFIRDKEVHFSLNRDTVPLGKPEGELKPSVKRRLARLHKEIKAGKGHSPVFNTADEAIRYLHARSSATARDRRG